MLGHYSLDTLDTVVKDVLLGVPSFSFAFPQIGLVPLKQLGLCFLDFCSQKICPVEKNLDMSEEVPR